MMRKAIRNCAIVVIGRRFFMIVCVASSHSCGRLLKKAWSNAIMFPEIMECTSEIRVCKPSYIPQEA